MSRALCVFLLLAWSVAGFGQFTQKERDGIAAALFLRNLSLLDLDAVRRDSGGPSPLPAVEQAIDHPLEGADALMRLQGSAGTGSVGDTLAKAQAQLRIPLDEGPELDAVPVPDAVPTPLKEPVGKILAAMQAANEEIHAALAGLSAAEKRTLIDSLPVEAVEGRVTFSFTKGPSATPQIVEGLLAKVDLRRLLGSASILAHRIERQIPALVKAKGTPIEASITFDSGGIPVELTGAGSQAHRSAAGGLCIALAGDNHFAGRYGAGVGAASVLIDLGDTASYEASDLGVGSGLLGVGLAYEYAPVAHFVTKSIGLGAGLLGVGALFRDGGDDYYKATSMAEGFGFHGIGLLLDTSGDDQYLLQGLGQGAGIEGGIGWLIDRAGNDSYACSGFPDASLAQGYGRGGLGLLTDLAGDDTYRATTRCQGAGERLGAGSLYDASGRDQYYAEASAQGFAAETGAGLLFDLAGNDTYIVRGGACHGTAQSRSVAILFDREGNDVYVAGDGRPGLATDGGLGLFLDAAGDDRYLSAPGGSVPGRYGDALGIFVDLKGEDSYVDGLDNGQARIELDGAVAYDMADTNDEFDIRNFGPSPGSAQNPGVAQIDALIDDGSTLAANRLVAIGAPAFQRIMLRPLASLSSPVFNSVVRLGHVLRQNAFTAVLAKLQSLEVSEQRRALFLAGSLGIGAAGPDVERLIKLPATRKEAAEAAGLLRVKSTLPTLLMLTGSADPSLALVAMLAVERMGDEAGIPSAQALVTSAVFPIRQSALRLLSHFSASGTLTAQKLVADPSERNKRIGIELYGRIGSEEALNQAGQFLTAATPGLRIQAMLALDGHCPAALRPTLSTLRSDPDPSVRAVAVRIDPGR